MNQIQHKIEMLPFSFQAEQTEALNHEMRGARPANRRMPVARNAGRNVGAKPISAQARTSSRKSPIKNPAKAGRAQTSKPGNFAKPAASYARPTAQQNIYLMQGGRQSPRPTQSGSQFVRWVQQRLNQILGLRLPLSGRLSQQDRNALRRLQARCGLTPTGRLDMPSRSCLYRLQSLRPRPTRLAASTNYADADPSFDQDSQYGDASDDADNSADALNPSDADKQSDQADDGVDAGDGAEGEIPHNIQSVLSRPQMAKYVDAGSGRSLQAAAADTKLKGVGGVYLITFDDRGQRRAYSGMSSDLQRRFQQHLHCLKFPVGLQRNYTVHYEAIANPSQARNKEAALNSLRHTLGGSLVNLRTELEAELFA